MRHVVSGDDDDSPTGRFETFAPKDVVSARLVSGSGRRQVPASVSVRPGPRMRTPRSTRGYRVPIRRCRAMLFSRAWAVELVE
ncbi:hypothetical protein C6I20_01940 [Aeromicrobium sp. A1-2]|nr:hypothetical protein C6I20_01940 [Aeromicrobium sp. A1-2]